MSVHEWERGEDEAELLVGEERVQDDHGDRGARVRPVGRGIKKKHKEKWESIAVWFWGPGSRSLLGAELTAGKFRVVFWVKFSFKLVLDAEIREYTNGQKAQEVVTNLCGRETWAF